MYKRQALLPVPDIPDVLQIWIHSLLQLRYQPGSHIPVSYTHLLSCTDFQKGRKGNIFQTRDKCIPQE